MTSSTRRDVIAAADATTLHGRVCDVARCDRAISRRYDVIAAADVADSRCVIAAAAV